MPRRYRPRIARTGSATYAVHLPAHERELLGHLVEQLRELLELTTDDPIVRRLFPTAYHDDAERDQEYQQLVRDELLEGRLAALAVVEASAAADELDEAELTAWLTALNDLRLVLGTRLDISEDPIEVAEDDPDAPALAVYGYLSVLLGDVVDALAQDLPPAVDPEM
jgi:hypothetical protein